MFSEIIYKRVNNTNFSIFLNLFDKYNYELSQYEGSEISEDGMFLSTEICQKYIHSSTHQAYIIYNQRKPIGFFAIYINSITKKYVVSELFIIYTYRKHGIAYNSISQLLNKHKGAWRVDMHHKNTKAIKFWERISQSSLVTNAYFSTNDSRVYFDGSRPTNLFFFTE